MIFCRALLGLRQLHDVIGGVFERDKLATARQRYRVFELTFPATVVHDIALRHLYCQKVGFPTRVCVPLFM